MFYVATQSTETDCLPAQTRVTCECLYSKGKKHWRQAVLLMSKQSKPSFINWSLYHMVEVYNQYV